ncbi:MAG: extracellular solute-binding protein [Spirochaetaceae bacterium]|nr:MAG: extracellular solute-binding protein [Spirochaetaceae bacterium]
MRKRSLFLLALAAAVSGAVVFAGGRREAVDHNTVTLGYNPFLSDSFTDAPAPIDVIREELARRYPDLTLEYHTMPQDMLDSLVIWMTSQDATVDIFGMDVPWATQFGRARWALPLNEHLPDLDQRITPAGLETFSYEGQWLAVPFWGSLTGLYYRTDILEEFGFEAPESVSEMVEIIRTVRAERSELAGLLWPGDRGDSLVMLYATLLYAFGGEYTDAEGNYRFDSPESIRAVQFLRDTITEGLSPEAVQIWERRESRQRFVSGDAIFSWDNHDIIVFLDDPEQSEVVGVWDFIPFPAEPEGQSVAVTGGFGFAVNPFSSKRESAIKVMDVIASEAVQRGFALAWGPVQQYIGLYDDPVVQRYNPNSEKLGPLVEIALNRPPSENYAELSGLLQEELNAAITGTRPVSQALANMQRRATALKR